MKISQARDETWVWWTTETKACIRRAVETFFTLTTFSSCRMAQLHMEKPHPLPPLGPWFLWGYKDTKVDIQFPLCFLGNPFWSGLIGTTGELVGLDSYKEKKQQGGASSNQPIDCGELHSCWQWCLSIDHCQWLCPSVELRWWPCLSMELDQQFCPFLSPRQRAILAVEPILCSHLKKEASQQPLPTAEHSPQHLLFFFRGAAPPVPHKSVP